MQAPRPLPPIRRSVPPIRRSALALLAALGLWLIPAAGPAQVAPRPNIFNTENLPSGDGATTEPGARRARFIRVNPPVVAAPDSPLRNPAPARFDLDSSRIDLNLFDDITMTAALEKTIYRNGTNFLATGVIDGWPQSQIVLVASGEILAGTISVPGLGIYQIRYAGDGLHKVIELDLARVPACGPLKRAPANPRPIRARKNVSRPVIGTEPGPFVSVSNDIPVAARLGLPLPDLVPPVEGDAITNTVIDVMVVYTTAARIGAGSTVAMDTTIDVAIAEANLAYQNSLIPVVLNLVFRGEVTYTETGNPGTDLSRLQNPSDGYMDGVHSLRNQYGADVVCLLTETMNTYAGLGYLMSNVSTNFSSYSFSVIRRVYATGVYTFAHELGHNMGCAHDRQNSSSGGAFPYSYGYRFTGNDNNVYRDIMAYAPGTRIAYFSNPNVNYLGTATGVAVGATNAADNATSISNTMATVAAFRSPVVIFSFPNTTNSLVETNASVTVNVGRTTVTNVSATVDYTTLDGTALAGLDYIATNGTLSYAAGETNKSITVALLDDALRENTETFTLRLSNPTPGTLFLSNATVYVTDDDSSYVGFGAATLAVAEDTNTFSVAVYRTGVTNTAVTMNYFATNGTAQAGLDFVATNGLLSFAAGETQKNVSVTVLNDATAENNETFTIKLVSPGNTAVASITNLVVTITTNDSSIVAFSSASNIVVEMDGTNATNITVTVARTGTTFNACTVDFATTNVTALAGSDYTATNGTIAFAAGETNKTISLSISGDDTLESTETFRVILRNPSDTRLTLATNTIYITDNDATAIGFNVATNSISETNASITLNLTRTGATNTAASVVYFTTNGTATAGGDYTAASGTVAFAAGQTTNAITLTLTNDSLNEGSEIFYVRLVNATNTLFAIVTNGITLLDDDASTVAFTVTNLTVAENTNSVAITVVRTGATNTAVSVNFQTTNATAVAGSDYGATNGLLQFAAGVETNTFSVVILDDTLAEGSQTFNIRLFNPTNTTLGASNLVLTISTNDSAFIAFSASTSSFTETNSTNATLTLTVNRTGTTNNRCTVNFATTNGTALAGLDYVATNGTLTFAAGMVTTQIVIAVSNDDLQESNETFRVLLSNPLDGTLTVATNLVTLADDDASLVGFLTNAVTVAETGTNVLFIVQRTGATNTAVAVNYATTNGGAAAGLDFTGTSGTLTFAPGVVSNSFLVDILDDLSQESNETFRVTLSAVTNSTLAFATNVVTITDDDMATVAFAVSAISVEEDTNAVTVSVYRTGATNTVVSTRFLTTNGTATAGTDYFATNGILSFGLGETSKTFTVRVINDGLAETNETINLRLANPTNTSLGISNLVLTITTNDSAIIAFASGTTSFSETNSTNSTITLTVNRTGTTNNLATATFTTTNVSALAGTDYLGTNGTLTFAPGVTITQIVVTVSNDDLQESNEVFQVVLGSPSDARIGIGTNVVTITDDDASLLGLTTNALTVAEAGTNVTFTIIRSGATNSAVAVNFTTTNTTATGGSDYAATNGTLYFAPTVTTNTITLAINDDALLEVNETFRLVLSAVTNATLTVGTNVVTITDDDAGGVAFATNAMAVAENTNAVTITVLRTGTTNTVVTVNFSTVNGTATAASDYFATNGMLSFGLGETSKTFTVRVIDDLLAEGNETINVRLANATNATLGTSNLVLTVTTNDSSVIALAGATTSFTETNSTNNTITFTVNRTGTTHNLATVNFATTNVTALAGSDYTATNGTLTFAAGLASTQIVVSITNDDLQETNETFLLVLSSPVDATVGIGTNVVTLADDDVGTVSLTTNAVTVAETGTNVTFTIIRAGATNTAVAVNFTTTNLSATGGTDYTATNGTLYFAPTVTTNTITVAVADDAMQETNETFRLILSSVTNATLIVGTNLVTITDDDASSLALATNAISVAEDTNSVTVTVYRTGTTNTAVTVRFATIDGTATAGTDYFATNGLLSFGLGETSKTLAVRIINDGLAENNETINIRLSNPTNTSLATSNLVLTITTNDSAILALASATTSFTETNSTNSTITLTVNRTGTTNNLTTVNFTTTNVTALAGLDYTGTNGTLTFAAGVTSTQIVVTVANDDLQESNKTFRLILSNPSDATLGIGTNVVTLIDDDVSVLSLETNAITVAESGTNVTIIVLRTGATNTAIAVDFRTTNGTALASGDYTATNGTLYFAPTVVSNSFKVEIADDLQLESTEIFLVRLSNATNTTLTSATNTITVSDDDVAGVGFALGSLSVSENTNSVTVAIIRSGVTNTTCTVRVVTTNGTALAGTDFIATNAIVSFAPGVTTNYFAVTVLNDLIAEGNESFSLRLVNPTNISLGMSNLVITITTNDSSIIAFTSATTSYTETNSTNNTLTLTVNRTGTTNNLATVAFTTTNVTALAGTDYAGTNGTLTFAAGVTSTQIVFAVSNDDLQESTETFRVVLSSPVDAILGIGTNVVTVTDDDVGTVGLTTNAVTVAETGTNITFTIIRAGATNTVVAVNFTTTNLSATGGTDYTATNGTLYFAPTVTTNTITIAVADDASQETNETFRLVLSGVTNATLTVGTNLVTITDDDASSLALATNAISVAESTNAVTMTVLRTGSTNTAVTVAFATINGTALAGSDYFATNGLLSFALGETSKTFVVRVIDDLLAEGNETVNIRLSNPTNTTLGTSNLVLTITTNDSAIIAFAAATTSFTETNSTNNTLTLTVNRTGTTNNLATVNFTTTNVTALAGSDYLATNGTLTFAAGVTSTQLVITVSNDDLEETNETFRVILSGPLDATLGIGTNVVTLTDDDGGTIGLVTNALTVAETGTNVTFTIIRLGATNTAVAVNFTTTNVTATGGVDYTATNGTLYFAPTVTTNLITLAIADDASQEVNETFRLILSGVTNATFAVATNTVTITDDDGSALTLATNVMSVTEDTNSISLTVYRTGATNTAVTVNFATLSGTALADSDYYSTNGLLSFGLGETSKTFTVRVINDAVTEGNETFSLRLSNPTNTSLGASNLVITITTNDSAIIALASATTSFTETNSTMTLTVNRTGTTNNLATVDFLTTNVTALAGSDYTATNGTLTFAAGVTSTQIVVTVLNDNLQESDETFRIILGNPNDAALGIGTNVVTLMDDDVSTLGLTTNAISVAETGTNVTFIIVRSGATNTAVAVDFTTTNGTATAGTDYTATNGVLYLAPGQVTNLITLAVADDALQEGNETFRLILSGLTNSTLLFGTNIATITDDDGSSLAFWTNAITVFENTNIITVSVLRTGATNTTISVNYTDLASSSATPGSDFGATNGTLIFGPAVTSNSFTVVINDDGIAENTELANFRLRNPTNTSLGVSNLVISITTNDSSVIAFASATTSFTETNDNNAAITLTINRTGTTNNLATVAFATSNVTALAGSDYLATNGTLTFAPGVVSTQIVVSIENDDLQESVETFRVVLSSPTDATITIATNTVTLTDDDISTVGFNTNAVTVAEAGTNVTFTIFRTGATNTATAVDFDTVNVTATGGSDYAATNGTISFAPGQASNSIILAITQDLLYETNETFRLVLSGLTNSTAGTATNTVTITDDDLAAVTFVVSSDEVSELDNTIDITVIRTGVTNTTVSVAYSTTNGTATAGSDYTATNGVLTFAPTETNKTITVSITFDSPVESPETFALRLVSLTNAAAGSNTTLVVTINDAFGGARPAFAPASMIPVSLSAFKMPDSEYLRVHVTGPTGVPFVIESTTDLKIWTPEITNVLRDGGYDWFTPIDPAVVARYFRVARPK